MSSLFADRAALLLPDATGRLVVRKVSGAEAPPSDLEDRLSRGPGSGQLPGLILTLDGERGVSGVLYAEGSVLPRERSHAVDSVRGRVAGGLDRILRFARDRSEHAELEALFASVAAAVCSLDDDGRVVRTNLEARRLLGAVPGEPLALETLTEMGDRRDDLAKDPILRAFTGETCRSVVVRRRDPGCPSQRLLALSASPVRDLLGRTTGAVVMAHDVTEEKVALRERERFLAVLGHDLRNPLWSMELQTHLLERSDSPERTRTLVHKIRTTARRLTRTVDQLLDAASLQQGRELALSVTGTCMRQLVEEAVSNLTTIARDNPIRVLASGDTRGAWDADRIYRALANLIANSLAYSPRGAPIEVVIRGDGKDEVEVVVADRGCGIAKAHLELIFQPNGRSDERRGRDLLSGTLGLGLFIVKSVVSAHGGSIGVESEEKKGTAFSVRLPALLSTPPPRPPRRGRRHGDHEDAPGRPLAASPGPEPQPAAPRHARLGPRGLGADRARPLARRRAARGRTRRRLARGRRPRARRSGRARVLPIASREPRGRGIPSSASSS